MTDTPLPGTRPNTQDSSTPEQRRIRRLRRQRAMNTFEAAVMIVIIVLVLFPIGWMVATAFKSPAVVYQYTMWFEPTLENFRNIFSERWNIGKNILNSSIVAISVVIIATPLAVGAAYAFSRLMFPLKRTMFQWILLTQFIPAVAIVLPFYVMFRTLNLLDTYFALIIVNLSGVLPYAIWTIKGFIDAIPIEAEEAARIDGAGRFRVIWDIVVPMAWPGIMTAAIFCLILTWNEFLFGYLLTRQHAVPLPVGLISFVLERGTVWELVAATGIIITIPMFFFAMIIQRHFTKGMNLGAVR
ncbi:carbohydrate ABC transporter permease [Albidovulum sp.]|uniref:carbohydrate ABC transporter permease n=1 Tax=Albidovulum sp. TaxID=1872424 RepID=UPI00352910B2